MCTLSRACSMSATSASSARRQSFSGASAALSAAPSSVTRLPPTAGRPLIVRASSSSGTALSATATGAAGAIAAVAAPIRRSACSTRRNRARPMLVSPSSRYATMPTTGASITTATHAAREAGARLARVSARAATSRCATNATAVIPHCSVACAPPASGTMRPPDDRRCAFSGRGGSIARPPVSGTLGERTHPARRPVGVFPPHNGGH